IAGFVQTLAERAHKVSGSVGRFATEEPDHWHRPLLRPRRKRPRRRRGATKEREEGAAVQGGPRPSMTSVALTKSVFGTVKPSALAVLRLINSSNLVGCITGRSPGLSPFNMRPA